MCIILHEIISSSTQADSNVAALMKKITMGLSKIVKLWVSVFKFIVMENLGILLKQEWKFMKCRALQRILRLSWYYEAHHDIMKLIMISWSSSWKGDYSIDLHHEWRSYRFEFHPSHGPNVSNTWYNFLLPNGRPSAMSAAFHTKKEKKGYENGFNSIFPCHEVFWAVHVFIFGRGKIRALISAVIIYWTVVCCCICKPQWDVTVEGLDTVIFFNGLPRTPLSETCCFEEVTFEITLGWGVDYCLE